MRLLVSGVMSTGRIVNIEAMVNLYFKDLALNYPNCCCSCQVALCLAVVSTEMVKRNSGQLQLLLQMSHFIMVSKLHNTLISAFDEYLYPPPVERLCDWLRLLACLHGGQEYFTTKTHLPFKV